jgi:hypothetical protein
MSATPRYSGQKHHAGARRVVFPEYGRNQSDDTDRDRQTWNMPDASPSAGCRNAMTALPVSLPCSPQLGSAAGILAVAASILLNLS